MTNREEPSVVGLRKQRVFSRLSSYQHYSVSKDWRKISLFRVCADWGRNKSQWIEGSWLYLQFLLACEKMRGRWAFVGEIRLAGPTIPSQWGKPPTPAEFERKHERNTRVCMMCVLSTKESCQWLSNCKHFHRGNNNALAYSLTANQGPF